MLYISSHLLWCTHNSQRKCKIPAKNKAVSLSVCLFSLPQSYKGKDFCLSGYNRDMITGWASFTKWACLRGNSLYLISRPSSSPGYWTLFYPLDQTTLQAEHCHHLGVVHLSRVLHLFGPPSLRLPHKHHNANGADNNDNDDYDSNTVIIIIITIAKKVYLVHCLGVKSDSKQSRQNKILLHILMNFWLTRGKSTTSVQTPKLPAASITSKLLHLLSQADKKPCIFGLLRIPVCLPCYMLPHGDREWGNQPQETRVWADPETVDGIGSL